MARIYKESRYVLQLLIGKSYGAQYEDIKISFYTKNPSNQVMVDNDITIKRNIAEVMVDSTLFDNLEEGLIKYIVYGTKDGIPFIEERQSNYFLKTPLDFKPTTCILEDKSVTPSMADRDGNNLIVVEESEGYDGLSRVVIDPGTIYNEGIEEGRNQFKVQDSKWVRPSMADRAENGDIYIRPDEGFNAVGYIDLDPGTIYNEGVEAGRAEGGGTTCNLGTLDWTLTSPSTEVKNASDDGYDGYSQVIIRPDNMISQEKERAINDFKNKMSEITITENGTFSIDDQEILHSIAFDGNSYFDTGIVPTENIKIEACIKITNGNNSGLGGIIIGGGIDPVDLANPNSTENRGIAIGMGGGAIYGVWGAKKSWNEPYKYEGEGTTTVVLQKTNDSWGWETEKGSFGASSLYIGGYNKNGQEVEEKFLQSIVYIKIWTNKDDDSTMTLFRPKNMTQGAFGVVNSEGIETSHIENLGVGTATFVEENVKKYPYGFKRVEVNVVSPFTTQEISYSDYQNLNNYDNNIIYLISE